VTDRGARAILLAWASLLAGCSDAVEPSRAKPVRVEPAAEEGAPPRIRLTPEAAARLGIETVAVESRATAPTRTLGGEVVVPAGGEVVVSSPVAAAVFGGSAGSFPRAGRHVRQGEVLFRLLALPAGQDLLGAEAELARAEAEHEVVVARATRAEQLLKDGAGSVRQVEEVRGERMAAEAALTLARARRDLLHGTPIESVAGAISPLFVAAPLDGLIRAVRVAEGQSVAPGTGLAEVSRQDPLWVRVGVYAGDVATFDSARGARVTSLAERVGDSGRLARSVPAPPTADAAAASADLYFELPNADLAFRPGQAVRATLALRGGERGLIVPAAALLYDAQGGVWLYERVAPETYQRRRVEVETQLDGEARIARGLAVDAQVVVAGAAELFGAEFGREGQVRAGEDAH
jgi:RND family efflux transporter MFP subunit